MHAFTLAMEETTSNQKPKAFRFPIEYYDGEEEPEDPYTLPTGFKFCPTDEELIEDFLIPKIRHQPLLCEGFVIDANVYDHSVKSLIGKYGDMMHEGVLYFFTPRNRKYMNGSRPDRAAVGGYWKATAADKPVLGGDGKTEIGAKKTLVFVDKQAKGMKQDLGKMANWMMVEYKVQESMVPVRTQRLADGRWRLDEYVLCKIYHGRASKKKAKNQQPQAVEPPNQGADPEPEHASIPSPIEQPEPDSIPSQSQQQPEPINKLACLPESSTALDHRLLQHPQTAWNQIAYTTIDQINITGQPDPSMPGHSLNNNQPAQPANIPSSSPTNHFAFSHPIPPSGSADLLTSDSICYNNFNSNITEPYRVAPLVRFQPEYMFYDHQQCIPCTHTICQFQSANQFPSMSRFPPGQSRLVLGQSSMTQVSVIQPGPSMYDLPPGQQRMRGQPSMAGYYHDRPFQPTTNRSCHHRIYRRRPPQGDSDA